MRRGRKEGREGTGREGGALTVGRSRGRGALSEEEKGRGDGGDEEGWVEARVRRRARGHLEGAGKVIWKRTDTCRSLLTKIGTSFNTASSWFWWFSCLAEQWAFIENGQKIERGQNCKTNEIRDEIKKNRQVNAVRATW